MKSTSNLKSKRSLNESKSSISNNNNNNNKDKENQIELRMTKLETIVAILTNQNENLTEKISELENSLNNKSNKSQTKKTKKSQITITPNKSNNIIQNLNLDIINETENEETDSASENENINKSRSTADSYTFNQENYNSNDSLISEENSNSEEDSDSNIIELKENKNKNWENIKKQNTLNSEILKDLITKVDLNSQFNQGLSKKFDDLSLQMNSNKSSMEDITVINFAFSKKIDNLSKLEKTIQDLIQQIKLMKTHNASWQADFLKNMNDFNEKIMNQEILLDQLENFEKNTNDNIANMQNELKEKLPKEINGRIDKIKEILEEKENLMKDYMNSKFLESKEISNILNTKLIQSEVNIKALWDSFTFFSDSVNNNNINKENVINN